MRDYRLAERGGLFLIDEFHGEEKHPARIAAVLNTKKQAAVVTGELNHAYQAGLKDAIPHPVIIGAENMGYVIVAAVPSGERQYAVVGQDPTRSRQFCTWIMYLRKSGTVDFELGHYDKATLADAVYDMLARAGVEDDKVGLNT